MLGEFGVGNIFPLGLFSFQRKSIPNGCGLFSKMHQFQIPTGRLSFHALPFFSLPPSLLLLSNEFYERRCLVVRPQGFLFLKKYFFFLFFQFTDDINMKTVSAESLKNFETAIRQTKNGQLVHIPSLFNAASLYRSINEFHYELKMLQFLEEAILRQSYQEEAEGEREGVSNAPLKGVFLEARSSSLHPSILSELTLKVT